MSPRDHWSQLADMGCTLQFWEGEICDGPVQIHHCGGGSMKDRGIHKAKGKKTNGWLAIPLCLSHHTGTRGIHTLGVKTWEAELGAQAHWLDLLCEELQVDLWAKAKEGA